MTVLDVARSQIGKPYSGPLSDIGGGRFGDPGFDCSSFVAWCYQQAGVPGLTAFTDAMYGQTGPDPDPAPGDLIFYRYTDPAQPGVQFPHMGLYEGGSQTIDSRYPRGVAERPILDRPHEFRRVAGGVAETDTSAIDATDGNSAQSPAGADVADVADVAAPEPIPWWVWAAGAAAVVWALEG